MLDKTPSSAEEKQIHDEYSLRNHRVFRKTPAGERWVVPRVARRTVLGYHHDQLGHFALAKTLSAVKQHYWFPNMREYVKNYIRACLPCQYNKNQGGQRPGELHPIEKGTIPFDTIHLDHLGPFKKSARKNTHLLVVIDAFSKYTLMKPVQSTKTAPVTNFLDNIFETFGVPRRIITDRGTAFTSKAFKTFCDKYSIKLVLCATATPRANGQVERMNRTILSAVTSSTDHEEQWDKTITNIQRGINATVSTATGKSPYELLLGYVPRGKGDAYLTNELQVPTNAVDLHTIRKEASERMATGQHAMKERYDRGKQSACKYQPHDLVLLRRPGVSTTGGSSKLEPPYQGPYEVAKVLPNDRYVVRDLPGSTRSQKSYEGIHPAEHLKPCIINEPVLYVTG